MEETQEIMVSICCITYNHAPFIKQCLDGFLMQETTFPIEIIINDDASTDGTTEIIREYQQKHPNLLYPIYHDENLYSQGVRGMFKKFVFPKARGKYLALCEGDDYWTDPLKLQKQVDFMEAHPDCSLCFHPVSFIPLYENEHVPYKDTIKLGYCSLGESEVPTCSMMFPRYVGDNIPTHPDFQVGDSPSIKTCSLYGSFFCLPDEMGVYRHHNGGWTAQDHLILKELLFKHFLAEKKFFRTPTAQKIIDSEIIAYFMAIRSLRQWGRFKTASMALTILPAQLSFDVFRKYFLPAFLGKIFPFIDRRKKQKNS